MTMTMNGVTSPATHLGGVRPGYRTDGRPDGWMGRRPPRSAGRAGAAGAR